MYTKKGSFDIMTPNNSMPGINIFFDFLSLLYFKGLMLLGNLWVATNQVKVRPSWSDAHVKQTIATLRVQIGCKIRSLLKLIG